MNSLESTLRYLEAPAFKVRGHRGLESTVVGTPFHEISVDEPFVLRLTLVRARTDPRRKSAQAGRA
jgi:hypothetical protein